MRRETGLGRGQCTTNAAPAETTRDGSGWTTEHAETRVARPACELSAARAESEARRGRRAGSASRHSSRGPGDFTSMTWVEDDTQVPGRGMPGSRGERRSPGSRSGRGTCEIVRFFYKFRNISISGGARIAIRIYAADTAQDVRRDNLRGERSISIFVISHRHYPGGRRVDVCGGEGRIALRL